MPSQKTDKLPILVVGGAGYIGSHVALELYAAGFYPIVYDSLETGHAESALHWPLELGDTRDPQRLDEVFRLYQPQAIIHLAASLSVAESVQNPFKYYDNNVVGSLKLLEACRRHGVDKIIFSSTAAVYGPSDQLMIAEDHVKAPINPYGFSKLVVEQMLSDYEKAYGLRSVALRYFNAAGADPAGRLGCRQKTPSNLLPLILQVLRGPKKYLEVFGSDYPTPDGSAIRDYIHVSDLAKAHLAALEYLLKGHASDVFNLGTGKGHSVLEVIRAVEQVIDRKVPYRLSARRPGDSCSLVANPNKAWRLLNWKAQLSDLATIVQSAWAFEKNSGDR